MLGWLQGELVPRPTLRTTVVVTMRAFEWVTLGSGVGCTTCGGLQQLWRSSLAASLFAASDNESPISSPSPHTAPVAAPSSLGRDCSLCACRRSYRRPASEAPLLAPRLQPRRRLQVVAVARVVVVEHRLQQQRRLGDKLVEGQLEGALDRRLIQRHVRSGGAGHGEQEDVAGGAEEEAAGRQARRGAEEALTEVEGAAYRLHG